MNAAGYVEMTGVWQWIDDAKGLATGQGRDILGICKGPIMHCRRDAKRLSILWGTQQSRMIAACHCLSGLHRAVVVADVVAIKKHIHPFARAFRDNKDAFGGKERPMAQNVLL
jgi:hypothetical protein